MGRGKRGTEAWRECSRLFPLPIVHRALTFFAPALALLLWDDCGGASLSEREQNNSGWLSSVLYKNPGNEVYKKEAVALDKCQTATQSTLILWILYYEIGGGVFNLATMMVLILLNEHKRKVEKLRNMKVEVMQPKVKNKSEIPAHE